MNPSPARSLLRRAAGFVALGLVLYVLLHAAAQQLLYRYGDANPMLRIATLDKPKVDWVVLGSSHAMPLGFGGFNDRMQRETGLAIVNLAATGAGPLYSRFVLEQFLRAHRTAGVLYVADAFAFQSRAWNEDRFADAKLQARTPWDPALAAALARYVRDEDVSWRAWADYASGFSRINNRDRFRPDRWEGECQFDRTWRPSASAVKKRIEYLYPDGMVATAQQRYLAQLDALIRIARAAGASVVVVRLPVPTAYRQALPDEAGFDAALARTANLAGAAYQDLSAAPTQAEFFFDSDHLNRAGATALFRQRLRALLAPATNRPESKEDSS